MQSRTLLGAAALFVLAPKAQAFCRTMTEDEPATHDAVVDGCWAEGKPLYWKRDCVQYYVNRRASEQVALREAQKALSEAFGAWASAACKGGSASFRPIDMGPTDINRVEYRVGETNQNVIMFRDDRWPYGPEKADLLALTTITYVPETGRIVDADMEINTSAEIRMAVGDDVPVGEYDLLSVITHDSGHFLGLAHTEDPRAVMAPKLEAGTDSKRILTSDDVSGICAGFPANKVRVTGDGEIPALACNAPDDPKSSDAIRVGNGRNASCTLTPGSHGARPMFWFLLLGVLIGLRAGQQRWPRSLV